MRYSYAVVRLIADVITPNRIYVYTAASIIAAWADSSLVITR